MNKLDPVVFRLGAALYICQIFENSLVLLHKLIDEEENLPREITKIGDDYSKKTLGHLINILKTRLDIEPKALNFIFKAIKIRNEIVHGYLTDIDRMEKFETKDGLDYLVKDLSNKASEVRARDLYVCDLINKYLVKHGTSTEALKDQAGDTSYLFN